MEQSTPKVENKCIECWNHSKIEVESESVPIEDNYYCSKHTKNALKLRDWMELKKELDNPTHESFKFFGIFMKNYGGPALSTAIDAYMKQKSKHWVPGEGYVYDKKMAVNNVWDKAKGNVHNAPAKVNSYKDGKELVTISGDLFHSA